MCCYFIKFCQVYSHNYFQPFSNPPDSPHAAICHNCKAPSDFERNKAYTTLYWDQWILYTLSLLPDTLVLTTVAEEHDASVE